jgi:hypothetical protein
LLDAIAGVVVEPVVAARGERVVEPAAVVSMVPVAAVSMGPDAAVPMVPDAVASMGRAAVVPMAPDAGVSMGPVVASMVRVSAVSMVRVSAVSMAPAAAVCQHQADSAVFAVGLDVVCRQVSREVSPVSPEASRGAGEFQRFLVDYKGCCRDARRISVDVFQVGLAPAGPVPVFQADASGAALAADTRPGQTIRPHDSRTKIHDGNPVHTPASSPPNRIPNAT